MTGALSPTMAAIASSHAEDARFDALPANLETTDPDRHGHEENRMLEAYTAACAETPTSWVEFVALLDLMTAGGRFGVEEDRAALMLRHARRLAGLPTGAAISAADARCREFGA